MVKMKRDYVKPYDKREAKDTKKAMASTAKSVAKVKDVKKPPKKKR
jgi:hypothetical protein